MKKYLLTFATLAVTLTAQAQPHIATDKLSDYDFNAAIGFAQGITGGEDENIVTVTTYAAFKSALAGTAKKTIYVDGTITFDGILSVSSVKNKTIVGMPGATFQNLNEDKATSESDKSAAIKKTGILELKKCDNIIIRNLTFQSAGACDFNGNDNLHLSGSTNIWVDHCDFQDGVDGNLDCTNGSDNVCVSWCRFRYLKSPREHGYGGSTNDHRFTNLWGNSDSNTSDPGKLRTTFYSCWWDEGCKERMPRVRFGLVHVLNCLYSSSVTNYCVGGGYKSNVYIEGCAFTSSKAKNTPWKNYATSGSKTDYNYTISNCQGTGDKQNRSGSNDYFVPADHYTYSSYDASIVESVVTDSETGAGPTIDIYTDDPSGITLASDQSARTVSWYDLNGRRLDAPAKGVSIRVERLANGQTITMKVVR